MKWLTGIWDIVASLSVKAKTCFCFAVLFIVGGYFILDRVLTFKRNMALAQPQIEKREVIKSDYSGDKKYKDRLFLDNKAIEIK